MAYYRQKWLKANPPVRGWYTCVRCGKKVRAKDMWVDHIVPQSYGGWHGLDNLQCLCADCNRHKSDSLRDTLPDYILNNINRARKKIFGD